MVVFYNDIMQSNFISPFSILPNKHVAHTYTFIFVMSPIESHLLCPKKWQHERLSTYNFFECLAQFYFANLQKKCCFIS